MDKGACQRSDSALNPITIPQHDSIDETNNITTAN